MLLKNICLCNICKNILETYIGRDEFNPMVIWSLAAVAYISWDTSVKEILEIPFPIEMNLCHSNINDCCFLIKSVSIEGSIYGYRHPKQSRLFKIYFWLIHIWKQVFFRSAALTNKYMKCVESSHNWKCKRNCLDMRYHVT